MLTLPAVAVLRAVLGKRVQTLMERRSPHGGHGNRLAPRVGRQVATKVAPRRVQLDHFTLPTEAESVRHAMGRDGFALFRRWWVYEALGLPAVLVVVDRFFMAPGQDSLALMFGGGLLAVLSVRYGICL